MPLSSGPTLFFAPSPIEWQGKHFLNDCLAGGHVLRLRSSRGCHQCQGRDYASNVLIAPLPVISTSPPGTGRLPMPIWFCPPYVSGRQIAHIVALEKTCRDETIHDVADA